MHPQDLPIKSHMPPDAPYVPLSTMLQLWASFESKQPPPGFVPPVPPPQLPISQPPPIPSSSNPLEALIKQQHPAVAHLGMSAPLQPPPTLAPHLGGPAWGAPGSAAPFAPHMPPQDPLGLAASHALPPQHPFAPPPPHPPPQQPHAPQQQGQQQGPLPNILPMLGLSNPPPAATSMPPPPFPPSPLSQSLSAASGPPASLPPFMGGAAPWGAMGPQPPLPPPSQPLSGPHPSMLHHTAPPLPSASAAPPQPPPTAPPMPPVGSSPTERLLSLLRGAQPQPQPSQPPSSLVGSVEAYEEG